MKQLMSFLSVLFFVQLNAQQIQVSPDRNPVGVGEQFTLTYAMSAQPTKVAMPDFKGFEVLGTSQSMKTEIVNGRVSSSFNYLITLKALEVGTYNVQPLKAVISGKQITSERIQIKVQQEATKQQRRRSNSPFDFFGEDDPFGFFNQRQQQPTISGTWNDNVFFRLIPDKKTAYVGEKIRLSLQLYFHPEIKIQDYNLLGFETAGFLIEDIVTNQQIQLETKRVGDKTFNYVTLGHVDVYPQIAGESVINPAKLSCVASINYYNRRRLELESNNISVNVKKLPSPKPASFIGYVGKLSATRTISDTVFIVNTGGNITYQFSGSGNIEVIDIDQAPLPPDFEVFEVDQVEKGNTKTIRFPFVTRNGGIYSVNAQEISYFDPSINQYQTIRFPSKKVRVTGQNTMGTAYAIGSPDSNAILGSPQQLNTDIRFLKTITQSKQSKLLFPFWSTLAFIFILSIGFLLFPLIKSSVQKAFLNKKSSLQLAIEQLEEGKEVENVYWNYAVNKSGIPLAKLSSSIWFQFLAKKATDELVTKHKEWLELAQISSFSAASSIDNIQEQLKLLLHETDQRI